MIKKQIIVKIEQWSSFVNEYHKKGFMWASGSKLMDYNPFESLTINTPESIVITLDVIRRRVAFRTIKQFDEYTASDPTRPVIPNYKCSIKRALMEDLM